MSHPQLDTVAVIGGSIAGLLAAAAVAPYAARVVVLERDELPAGRATRPGTPQATHSHGLLASGRESMERLLPGFTQRLEELGAEHAGDIGSSGRWWLGGGLLADTELGSSGVAAS